MSSLLVGFDSAWTANNSGAIAALIRNDAGNFIEISSPQVVNYNQATMQIQTWQNQLNPTNTIIMLDQPTIVNNQVGQRPVENIVSSPVSLRYGGVQPANIGRTEMFGQNAPVWQFLNNFQGPGNPLNPLAIQNGTCVLETYPVLTLISLGWTLQDLHRPTGRLPKYNPKNRRNFSIQDWQFLCRMMLDVFRRFQLPNTTNYIDNLSLINRPTKQDQDCLDAYICLLVAVYFSLGVNNRMMVGNIESGYMVIPYNIQLFNEIVNRCEQTRRDPANWVHQF